MNQINNKEQELNFQNLPNISTLPKTRKMNKAVEDAKKALISFKKTINRISKQTELKIRISKKKIGIIIRRKFIRKHPEKIFRKYFWFNL